MSEDFKMLIAKATFLSPEEKQIYSIVFDYIDEGKKAQLKEIITSAVNGEVAIDEAAKKAKSDAIKEFLATCHAAVKTEHQAAMNEEEDSYKQAADKLLDNL